MKKIFSVLLLIGLSTAVMAQTASKNQTLTDNSVLSRGLDKNQFTASAGIMTGSYGLTPITAQFEYGIAKNLGIGAKVWHGNFLEDGDRTSLTYWGLFGNYHLGELLKLSQFDPYLGLSVGVAKYRFEDIADTTPPAAGLQIGGRYFFNKRFAGYGQFNLSLDENVFSLAEAGITLRIGK